VLLFRGHSIEQLWHCDFEDILYLTLFSALPSDDERKRLGQRIAREMENVPQAAVKAVEAIP